MFLNLLTQDPLQYFRVVVILILSITLHELAHGLAALHQGDDTPSRYGHMTLNPVVHMGWVSIICLCMSGITWGQMPVNPARFRDPKWGNVWVSAAGPLSNLALGLIAIALLAIAQRTDFLSPEFFSLMAQTNFVLFLFNLLPIPPLDGFHVFSPIFPPLKALDNSSIGFLPMMFLFLLPGFGAGLYALANLMIRAMVSNPVATIVHWNIA